MIFVVDSIQYKLFSLTEWQMFVCCCFFVVLLLLLFSSFFFNSFGGRMKYQKKNKEFFMMCFTRCLFVCFLPLSALLAGHVAVHCAAEKPRDGYPKMHHPLEF